MDNFRIDVTSEGRGNLDLALRIAFGSHRHATHYAVRDEVEGEQHPDDYLEKYPHMRGVWKVRPRPRRLVFYWSASESAKDLIPLPFKLDAEGAVDFVSRWLAEQDFGSEPDHDGDNGKGWRVYNESWGHVDDHWGAFVAITPAWAMYGK